MLVPIAILGRRTGARHEVLGFGWRHFAGGVRDVVAYALGA
jgi:hypothetical protein